MTPDEWELDQLADLEDGDPSDWGDATVERLLSGYGALVRDEARLDTLWRQRLADLHAEMDHQLNTRRDRIKRLRLSLETWARARREMVGATSTVLPSGTIATRAGSVSLVVADIDEVPTEWLAEPVPPPPRVDAKRAKAHMAEGNAIPGLGLERSVVGVKITPTVLE